MSKKNITDPESPDFDLDSFLNSAPAVEKLSNEQFEALEIFLESHPNGMHMEIMDGFFCGLICGPDVTGPEDFIQYIFGGREPNYKSAEQAEEILGYLRQHWDHIESTISNGDSYYPFLYSDNNFKVSGNDWAFGFVLSIDKYRDSWSELLEISQQEEGLLTPILALYLERSTPDEPIHAENREVLVTTLIENLPKIYDYFEEAREKKLQGQLH